MRLNPNLQSRIDQDAALQTLRDEEYERERQAWINKANTEYSNRYYRPSRWRTFCEYLGFFWWLAKMVAVVAVVVLFFLGLIEIARNFAIGRP